MHFYAYVFELELVGLGLSAGARGGATAGGAGAGTGLRLGLGEGSACVVEDFEFVEGGVRGGCATVWVFGGFFVDAVMLSACSALAPIARARGGVSVGLSIGAAVPVLV